MCRFIDSIKVKNGRWYYPDFHNKRINRTIQAFYQKKTDIRIENDLRIPAGCRSGLYKCRLVYTDQIIRQDFILYQKKKMASLKGVYDDEISYGYKYEDRQRLNELFSQRGSCDDVIIIRKGRVTDASYSNLVFYDGRDWITPSSPLLPGTCRKRLLENGVIKEKAIPPEEIRNFLKVRLINAMMDFAEAPEVPVENIILA